MFKPKTGRKLFNIDGVYMGIVSRCETNICHYTNPCGVEDLFIWKFKEGLNKRIDWSLF
jgi:hypothetical protein